MCVHLNHHEYNSAAVKSARGVSLQAKLGRQARLPIHPQPVHGLEQVLMQLQGKAGMRKLVPVLNTNCSSASYACEVWYMQSSPACGTAESMHLMFSCSMVHVYRLHPVPLC